MWRWGLLLALLVGARPALAVEATVSVQTGFTITAGNTFQSLAPETRIRAACLIQNTSTHTLYVFFGPTASATLAKSFQVAAGGFISCANQNGTVLVDNIAVTTSTTGDTGVLNLN